MDLKALHSLMSRKQFHYFEGQTNNRDNTLYLSFSTQHNGSGDCVEIRIGEIDNDIECWINSTNFEMKNVSDNDIFLLIETRC